MAFASTTYGFSAAAVSQISNWVTGFGLASLSLSPISPYERRIALISSRSMALLEQVAVLIASREIPVEFMNSWPRGAE